MLVRKYCSYFIKLFWKALSIRYSMSAWHSNLCLKPKPACLTQMAMKVMGRSEKLLLQDIYLCSDKHSEHCLIKSMFPHGKTYLSLRQSGHFFMNVCDVVYVCILLLYVFILYDYDF